MKNKALLDQLKCIIKTDCHTIDDYQDEMPEESATESPDHYFHPFDIDEVFAN